MSTNQTLRSKKLMVELNYETESWIYLEGKGTKDIPGIQNCMNKQRLGDMVQLTTLFQNGQRERCEGEGREGEREGQRRKSLNACVLI